jgi:hypothetical protein
MIMVILQSSYKYRFRIEIINPLAQIANTYNDYNLKKSMVILDWITKFSKMISSSIGFNTSNSESKSFAKQVLYWINPSDKVFDVLKFGFSKR